MIYAEVIGDPIAQSKSPLIHKHWLAQLGLEGDYRATRVEPGSLNRFMESRRADPDWRGCNVTIPHKQQIVALLREVDASAAAVGAVNCVVPGGDKLAGFNTDIDGMASALDAIEFRGRRAVLIGAGGAARAAVAYLEKRKAAAITILVRDPKKAESLRTLAPSADFEVQRIGEAKGITEPAAIINASPLGMVGATQMPASLLEFVAAHSADATVFDMVYSPLETDFLRAGRDGGGQAVDGLTMLIGQAAKAFELFFGQAAPPPDQRLRELLTA